MAVAPPHIGVVQRCMDINGFAIEPRADFADPIGASNGGVFGFEPRAAEQLVSQTWQANIRIPRSHLTVLGF